MICVYWRLLTAFAQGPSLSGDSPDDSFADDSESPIPPVSSWYPDSEEESERAVLERLLEQDERDYRSGPMRLSTVDDMMLRVSCANHLLEFDTTLRL